MNIGGLLAQGALALRHAGIEDPALDARLLFEHLAAMTRTEILLREQQPVAEHLVSRYHELITRRSRREPLHYITGVREFWSLEFSVSPAVLIPRPETEFLLEQALQLVPAGRGAERALDMCTGSGVIAVVLARELGCAVTAVDISADALAVAAGNISRHRVSQQVTLVCADLFSALRPEQQFDLIVSNPPYVAAEDVAELAPEVSRAEPLLALLGGPGGLECIRRLAVEAGGHLRPGGWLLVEIGADQAPAVKELFLSAPHRYTSVDTLEDWSGRPRVLRARRPASDE